MNARATAIANENRAIDQSVSRAVATREAEEQRPRTALESMAFRLKVTPSSLQNTLR